MNEHNKFSSELIELLKNKDKEAFNTIYNITSPKAYYIALKITQNEHDAEDILQDSYLKLLEKIDEIDPKGNFENWFYIIVANKSKNYIKKIKPIMLEEDDDFWEEIPEESSEFIPEESLNQESLHEEIVAAIDELTVEKRACVLLKYFTGLSVNEISESLGVPVSTVKNRLYTSRKELKEKLKKINPDILFGAAIGSIVVWALDKSSLSVSAAFVSGTSSANILSTIGFKSAGSVASTSSVSGGAVVAAKSTTVLIAQKIAAGVAIAGVIGGSTAGVVTVIKNNHENASDSYIEEMTTRPYEETSAYLFEEITIPTTAEISTSEITSEKEIENIITNTQNHATTLTKKQTEVTTKAETMPTTLKAVTQPTTQPTTAKAVTTTAVESTTEKITKPVTTINSTTQGKATLIINVTDFDDNVVDTLSLNVDAGTVLSWDFLVTLVSQHGYEAMSGVFGDAVESVAETGKTYYFTAEL